MTKYLIGSLMTIFGSSMLLFTALLFTYIDNRHIPLSPLFIAPAIISIIGIIVMMLTISPLMTLVVILTLPLYILVTALVAKRSQKYFAAQQKEIGALNGHVEEMYTGHKIVKAFGHERDSIEEFNNINDRLYNSGWKAQFISGIIMPMMRFVSNIGYVIVCVSI